MLDLQIEFELQLVHVYQQNLRPNEAIRARIIMVPSFFYTEKYTK